MYIFDTIRDAIEDILHRDRITEMANLRKRNTGIDGLIYTSTKQASHGPRVKYFPEGNIGGPCVIMTVETKPRLVRTIRMSRREADAYSKTVSPWITINMPALLKFWNEGANWDVHEISDFFTTIKKV